MFYVEHFTIQSEGLKCKSKGLKINPEKCKAMCISTLRDYKERSGILSSFSINSTVIKYAKQSKYLGFTIDSGLTDTAHVKCIFTKFRKAIMVFKSTVRVSKLTLLKRLARTYILPTLYNLEFIQKFSDANISRYDFLMARFFNVNKEKFDSIRGDTHFICPRC